MGFTWQEYWSGLPFSSPGDLPNPGIEPASLMSLTLAGRFFTTNATWEAQNTSLPLPNSRGAVVPSAEAPGGGGDPGFLRRGREKDALVLVAS